MENLTGSGPSDCVEWYYAVVNFSNEKQFNEICNLSEKSILKDYYFNQDDDGFYSFDYLLRFLHETENAAKIGDNSKVTSCKGILAKLNMTLQREKNNSKHSEEIKK